MSEMQSKNETRYVFERQQRLRLVSMILPAMIGALLLVWAIGIGEDFFYNKSLVPKEFYLILAISLLGFSGLTTVMTYLQTGFKRSTEVEYGAVSFQRELEENFLTQKVELEKFTEQLRYQLQVMQEESELLKSRIFSVTENDRARIINELKTKLISETNSTILSELKLQVTSEYKRGTQYKELLQRFDETRHRLGKELEALSWRGNLNLSLGALTTVIGLGLLGWSVYSQTAIPTSLWELATHFVPRMTLVIMIELFAYFFLSLYKTSLQEIKYFQNELTNIEAKQIALRAALECEDKPMIAKIIGKLAVTERNHIIGKDQTTVELEKAKIDKQHNSDLAKYATKLFREKPE